MAAADNAQMWSIPHLSDLHLFHATIIDYAFKRHMHDYFVIGIVAEGVQKFAHRGTTHITSAGGLIVLNPCEAHDGEAATEAGFIYRAMYPEAEQLQKIASEVSDRPRDVPFFPQPVTHDSWLVGQILGLHDALINGKPKLEQESRYLWTLGHLILRYADSRPPVKTAGNERYEVRRIRRYIDDHFAEDISLERLAALVNWSPFYLLRVFGKEVGLPPHAYLESVRVRRAQDMMQRGLPLAQIAYDTGFSSQSHLTNSFKRMIGVTPGRYAQERNILQDNAGRPPLS